MMDRDPLMTYFFIAYPEMNCDRIKYSLHFAILESKNFRFQLADQILGEKYE